MNKPFTKMPLIGGGYAIVDQEDYEVLRQWEWHLHPRGYAFRRESRDGKRVHIFMHRFIANTPNGLETDHINMDKLDNRKINLRCVPHSINERNKPISPRNKSGYRGVCWDKSEQKWKAQTSHNGKHINLGRFDTVEEAAAAHKEWLQSNLPNVATGPASR